MAVFECLKKTCTRGVRPRTEGAQVQVGAASPNSILEKQVESQVS